MVSWWNIDETDETKYAVTEEKQYLSLNGNCEIVCKLDNTTNGQIGRQSKKSIIAQKYLFQQEMIFSINQKLQSNKK